MFLKKIQSSGFKSFADKVTINLEKTHITGIVGPNGSGKSNVIDAVRWVMGEQNAKMLRGEKATDIIFAGSEKRNPLGMAEVTLVFDNNEGSPFCPPEYRHEPEILLTRRLYIDGQREYLINRKPCRLKDLISFFTSTGLGGRTYSMIQQGQVDQILQAKPEQIREILEEAAGVSIFKQKQHETDKKLEKTMENLSRVEDISVEIDRQIDALKEQVEKAKTWQDLNQNLKDREISLFAHNYSHFNKQKRLLGDAINEHSLREVACIGEISSLEKKYEQLKFTLNEADPELNLLNEEIIVLREKIASAEASYQNFEQLLQNGDARLASFDEDLNEQIDRLKSTEEEFESVSKRLERAGQESQDLEDAIENLSDQAEMSDEEIHVYENKVHELQEEYRNLERFLENSKLRKNNIEQEYSKSSKKMREHTEKLLELEDLYSETQILIDAYSVKRNKQRSGLEKELSEKKQIENTIRFEEEKLQEERTCYDMKREEFLEKKATLNSLIDIEQNSQDVIGKLKQLGSSLGESNPFLILTDYISFGKNYEALPKKLRSTFELWSERILIKDSQHLNQVISIAHQNKLGGICASSLTETTSSSPMNAWKEKWSLNSISEYLDIKDDTIPNISEILKRVFISTDPNLPEELYTEMPHEVVLLTENGLNFSSSKDFLITSLDRQGVLSRQKTITTLEGEILDSEKNLNLIQENIKKCQQNIKDEKDRLSKLDNLILQKNQDLLEILSDLKTEENKLSYQKEQIDFSKKDYSQLEEICEKFGRELSELKNSELALVTEKENTKIALDDAKLEATELKDKKEEVQRQLDQKKIELASLNSMSQTLQEHFERDQLQFENLKEKVKKKQQEREHLDQEIKESQSNASMLTDKIAAYINQRETLEKQLLSKKEKNLALVEELRAYENQIKEAREMISSAQKFVSEKNLELERAKIGTQSVIEQAREKYHIDIRTYSFEEQDNFDVKQESKNVSNIRSKIESMGLINMMALDEYNELTERQKFIQSQKDEINSSIELLNQAISEIEDTSKTKFLNTFTTLNHEFGELFPILFPRGEAQIQLTDPDNPLAGGVEIMVRLPGKKRQNMRLFSGGEKALTAIALIFALLKSKPTPFCFLDEVDAPLDETNVSRYNNVLEALADKFQFIIITHRRRTMEVLDTLYGVTMQEPGVSKVVGVDMNKNLPVHLQKAFKEEQRQGASMS